MGFKTVKIIIMMMHVIIVIINFPKLDLLKNSELFLHSNWNIFVQRIARDFIFAAFDQKLYTLQEQMLFKDFFKHKFWRICGI